MTAGPRPRPDPESHADERPAHRVKLPRFFIARYPVTVEQWRLYHDTVDAETRQTLDPRSLERPVNYPVFWVSWHDAMGYCRWFTRQLQESPRTPEPLAKLLRHGDETGRPWVVTLPSEAEWEKAARGADGRRYPWGDAWDANRAMAWEIKIYGSSSGCFPGGRGPAGTEEQSGNVWEWTRSLWGGDLSRPDYRYPYRPDYGGLGRENQSATDDVFRVLRGGAFADGPTYLARRAATEAVRPNATTTLVFVWWCLRSPILWIFEDSGL